MPRAGAIMRKEFSAYLDLIRFTAALAVVASHFTYTQFVASAPYPAVIGRLAVAWFFVLSGYVIAYVVHEKESTLKQYAVSRAARIYSVAIPAIVLTLAIDFYSMRHGLTTGLPLYEYPKFWKYLPVFLGFGGEIAGNHAQVFSDAPFWSLSYEVWYYVAFGCFFYLRGKRRLALCLIVIPILGIPALLYFPIWILGGVIYQAHQKVSISPQVARVGAVVTGAAFLALVFAGFFDAADDGVNALLNGWPRAHLHYSMNFPSFYSTGILAAANIFFARYCKLQIFSGQTVRRSATYLASFTFAIYLAHRPLMNLWLLVIRHNPHSVLSVSGLVGFTLMSCWLFGLVSEKQKGTWRAMFQWMLDGSNMRATNALTTWLVNSNLRWRRS